MKIKNFVDKSLLLAIGSSYDTIWRDMNSRLRREDCSLLQAIIIVALFFEKTAESSPSALAAHIGTSRGNISHCLSGLEKRGWIKRSLDSQDARSYRITLKPEGKKLAVRLMRVIDEIEGGFERQFGKATIQTTVDQLRLFQSTYREKSAQRLV